ncbi:MAG: hypothetical protein ACP5HJ_00450 [Candidatus Micrarchaeia archaeon]
MRLQVSIEFLSFLLFSSLIFLASIPLLLKTKEYLKNSYDYYYLNNVGLKLSQFFSSYCDSQGEINVYLLNSTAISISNKSLYIAHNKIEQSFPSYCDLNFSFFSDSSSNYSFKIKFGEVVISKAKY